MPSDPDIARVPESRCLSCGANVNRAGTGDPAIPARPQPGDITACLRCGAVMKFDGDLRLRGFTDAEAEELLGDRETMRRLAQVVRRIHVVRHALG